MEPRDIVKMHVMAQIGALEDQNCIDKQIVLL